MSLREWEEIWRKGRICYEHHERWCQKSLWNQDKQLPLASPCPLKQSPTRKVGGQGFQLHKHRLTNPSSWFLLNMVGNVFQEVLIHHTPGNAVRLAGLQLSSLSFFFLETGVMLLFFPNPLNSPHSHNFSDMIMSGLTMPIPLIIKDDPVRSHGLVRVQFTQMFPEFILLYWGSLHISKLSHGLEGPGIPEDNSRQKIMKRWRHSALQYFPCPLSPVELQPSSILEHFSHFLVCWYSSESPHHLSPVRAANVPTALCYKGQTSPQRVSILPIEHL